MVALSTLGFQLGGWQRIGVVLSCLWLIPGLFLVDWKSIERNDSEAKDRYAVCHSDALNESVKGREKVNPELCKPEATGLDAVWAQHVGACRSGYQDNYYKRPRAPSQAASFVAACDASFTQSHQWARERFQNHLLLVFMPPPVVWIMALTVRWVRRGFAQTKASAK